MASSYLIIVISAFLILAEQGTVRLQGRVVDEDGKPVADLQVTIEPPGGQLESIRTDVLGRFIYSATQAGEYWLSCNRTGFFRLTNEPFNLKEGDNEITFTINHETEIHEQVEVYSSSEEINPQDTSHSDVLIAREIRDIPVKSTHDLKSSLQALPEVVRDNSGQIHVAGGREGDTKYLLDGFDVGDPVTGSLSVRLNVDNLRTVEVERGRFDMQHDNAGAGLLTMDTESGDDRWRASATNVIPGFSIHNGIHLTSWYPRLALSGPLRKGRAWFSESLSIQRTLSLIDDLPRNADSISQWAGDSMLRTQIKISSQNLLQGNFIYNQRNASNLGLGPTAPISTTRGNRSYRSFFSLKDQLWSGRTFVELGMAADFSHAEILPHGSEPFRITPEGTLGNHFEAIRQKARRWQTFASVSLPSRNLLGTHDLQFGVKFSHTGWSQSAQRNEIEIRRSDDTVLQRTRFSGPERLHLTDRTAGVFVQDSWRISQPLVLQIGGRLDYNRLLRNISPSQRIALSILPLKNESAKLTLSWGVSLQAVTLSMFGPAVDQQRIDTYFARTSEVPVLGPVLTGFRLAERNLRQPVFYTSSIGWEQSIGTQSLVKLNLIHRKGRFGLAYEKRGESPISGENTYILENNRRDRYRSYQILVRHAFSDKTGLSASYTRSSARTNHVFDYSLDTPVFAPQEPGPLAWDAPNRFVSSGWAPLSVGNLLFSYLLEHRTGFPFSIVDEQQQIVGPAHASRFPAYTSLNLGVEKRIRLLARNWAVRLSLLNSLGRKNPDGVVNNIDSPDFLDYFGGQKRGFNFRLRLIQ